MTIDVRKTLALAVGVLAIAAPAATASGGPHVIASGLDNPRGLDFGSGGELYVAEAGRGGSDCTLENPEGGGAGCFGKTGAITKIDKRGTKQRVVSNLPSVASPTGGEAS